MVDQSIQMADETLVAAVADLLHEQVLQLLLAEHHVRQRIESVRFGRLNAGRVVRVLQSVQLLVVRVQLVQTLVVVLEAGVEERTERSAALVVVGLLKLRVDLSRWPHHRTRLRLEQAGRKQVLDRVLLVVGGRGFEIGIWTGEYLDRWAFG